MSDLDPFNHVNNGAQCNYFDFGRSFYFEKVFEEKIDWKSMDMVLVHLELDFHSPITFGENLFCETKITELGHKSFKMLQQLIDVDSQIIKTTCLSVLSGIDRETLKSAPINPQKKLKIVQFEKL